jgi:hypothetical protein
MELARIFAISNNSATSDNQIGDFARFRIYDGIINTW